MRKRLLVILFVALLTIPLALLLRDFVRDLFVIELLRVVWAGRLLFESLPQWPIWVLLLAILVVITATSLGRSRKPVRKVVEEEPRHQGRVQMLARWIRRTSKGTYFRWSLAQYMGGLAWDVMAYHRHITPNQLREELQAGRLDLPPVVQDYLESAQSRSTTMSDGFFARLRVRFARGDSPASYDPALESVIQFLEAELEIKAQQLPAGHLPEVHHDR